MSQGIQQAAPRSQARAGGNKQSFQLMEATMLPYHSLLQIIIYRLLSHEPSRNSFRITIWQYLLKVSFHPPIVHIGTAKPHT
jgi:hypothetical protein